MFGYLMRNRVIFIGSRINDEVSPSMMCTSIRNTPKQAGMSAAMTKQSCLSSAEMVPLLQVATNIVASLLAMEAMNDSEDIKLYINSPGVHPAKAPFLGKEKFLAQIANMMCPIAEMVISESWLPGGQSYSVIALLDTIEAIKPDVTTIALGLCASTATLLLAAGAKGKRFAMPSARIMMHQPAGALMLLDFPA